MEMDRSRSPWRGRRWSAWAVSAVFVAGLCSPLAAQETERGWLGVRVEKRLDCQWDAEGERKPCRRWLTVSSVLDGGPADRAGMEPGDRLIAVNGQSLEVAPAEQDRLLGTIRPGTPVSIDVERDGTHHFVRVTPGRRPSESRLSEARWRGRNRFSFGPDVYVVTAGRLRGHSDSAIAVTIRTDSQGSVRVLPSRISVEEGRIYARELDEGQFEWQGALPPEFRRVNVALDAALLSLQDSLFRRATVKLDSLRKLMRHYWSDQRAAERSRALARDAAPAVGIGYGRRLAGAEFEPLNPDLAEALEGTDTGLLVLRVLPGTPAAQLGLRPGDVVTRAGDLECEDLTDLRSALWRDPTGDSITLRWVRKGREMSGVLKKIEP